MLCFWRERVRWWIRVLAFVAIIGAVLGVSALYPEWGDINDWATLCLVAMLILNLCFGSKAEKFVEVGWKFSAFALTVAGVLFEPMSNYGYGIKLACSLVVILTLIYAIFGHTLLQKSSFRAKAYDVLFWLLIIASLVVANFVDDFVLAFPIETDSRTIFVPFEIPLYIIAYLRFEPLYNFVERLVKGSSYEPVRASSVKTDDRSCKNCTYYRIREGQGYATYPYCLKHQRDIGALEVYGKCGDYERR